MSDSSDYFSVLVVEAAGERIVVVKGEIDLRAADDLWGGIETVLADGPPRLVLDMVDTTFMDSSGLNTLLRAYAALGRLPEALVLRTPSPAVRRVIALAGIEDLFTYDDG
ncbi:MAG TPA: STAS domain-containing protein [Acidimicrobiales bacterium]|nr:STAS domain-containing protein [Acidimicrobiales bacterium]